MRPFFKKITHNMCCPFPHNRNWFCIDPHNPCNVPVHVYECPEGFCEGENKCAEDRMEFGECEVAWFLFVSTFGGGW